MLTTSERVELHRGVHGLYVCCVVFWYFVGGEERATLCQIELKIAIVKGKICSSYY